MHLVVVKFYDPTTFNGWTAIESACSLPSKACYAAGWLLPKKNKKDKITRVGLLVDSDEAEYSGIIAIPDGAIVEKRAIKDVKIG